MKPAGKPTISYLTGGLGNQLFELSCGLYFCENQELILESNLGKPRLNSDGRPDLASFKLPHWVKFSEPKKENKFVARCNNFMLRQGINQEKYEKIPGYFLVTKTVCSIVLSIYFRRTIKMQIGRDIGFSVLNADAKSLFLLGYFQTYIWASDPRVKSSLRNLQLMENSIEVDFYKSLAESEKPLVVHFRLGDYLQEDAFGLPCLDYYKNAITELWSTGKYNKIWAFSDEPNKARELFSGALSENVRWIPEIENSAAKTLEVMRLGLGYIIANSTFSWWGAFLAYEKDIDVIAPEPWFIKIEDPSKLIPPEWKSRSSAK